MENDSSSIECRGLTVKELAQVLGVDSGSLSRWESGDRESQGKYRDLVQGFVSSALLPDISEIIEIALIERQKYPPSQSGPPVSSDGE